MTRSPRAYQMWLGSSNVFIIIHHMSLPYCCCIAGNKHPDAHGQCMCRSGHQLEHAYLMAWQVLSQPEAPEPARMPSRGSDAKHAVGAALSEVGVLASCCSVADLWSLTPMIIIIASTTKACCMHMLPLDAGMAQLLKSRMRRAASSWRAMSVECWPGEH